MKREFEMTDADLAALYEACKPVPYIVIGGIPPRSPQENANDAWAALGRKMGFEPFSVEPVPGKSDKFFLAEPTP